MECRAPRTALRLVGGGERVEWLDPLDVDDQPIPAVQLLENHHLRAAYLNDGVGTHPLL